MKKIITAIAILLFAGMAAMAQETTYAKSDFVPGDEIIFDDNFEGERLGEFPMSWDLLDGYAEMAQQQGRNVIAFTDNGLGQVMPLMKKKWDWLPEVFTVEFDLFVAPMNTGDEEETTLDMNIYFGDRGDDSYYNSSSYVKFWYREDGSCNLTWSLLKPDGDNQSSGEKMLGLNSGNSDYLEKDNPVVAGEWNHFAFSFNKRAFKGYVNGVRMINLHRVEQCAHRTRCRAALRPPHHRRQNRFLRHHLRDWQGRPEAGIRHRNQPRGQTDARASRA